MNQQQPTTVAVEAIIDAPPETVHALITDVTRMGEWSPETVSARWKGDATGPVVGARFTGHNRLGRMRWTTTPEVTAHEPERLFEFTVPGRAGSTWRYEIEPVGAGTRVTETFEQRGTVPWPIRFLMRRAGVTDRPEHLRSGMTTTLQRLSTAAASATVHTTMQGDTQWNT